MEADDIRFFAEAMREAPGRVKLALTIASRENPPEIEATLLINFCGTPELAFSTAEEFISIATSESQGVEIINYWHKVRDMIILHLPKN